MSIFVCRLPPITSLLFFFNDTATTEIYTLSLHDALPISSDSRPRPSRSTPRERADSSHRRRDPGLLPRPQHLLRPAAGAVDPRDLGADAPGRGRGLPALDAERRPAADHDPRPRA